MPPQKNYTQSVANGILCGNVRAAESSCLHSLGHRNQFAEGCPKTSKMVDQGEYGMGVQEATDGKMQLGTRPGTAACETVSLIARNYNTIRRRCGQP